MRRARKTDVIHGRRSDTIIDGKRRLHDGGQRRPMHEICISARAYRDRLGVGDGQRRREAKRRGNALLPSLSSFLLQTYFVPFGGNLYSSAQPRKIEIRAQVLGATFQARPCEQIIFFNCFFQMCDWLAAANWAVIAIDAFLLGRREMNDSGE